MNAGKTPGKLIVSWARDLTKSSKVDPGAEKKNRLVFCVIFKGNKRNDFF